MIDRYIVYIAADARSIVVLYSTDNRPILGGYIDRDIDRESTDIPTVTIDRGPLQDTRSSYFGISRLNVILSFFNLSFFRFIGMVHSGHCLSHSIDKSHKVLVFKTNEQLKVMLGSTSEQWITGPAGSGKTWILMEKVKCIAQKAILHESGQKILVICHSLPLSKMLKKTFEDHLTNLLQGDDLSSVVEVKTFSNLLFEITGKCSQYDQEKEENIAAAVKRLEKWMPPQWQYDHIFVDECQDLIGDRWPALFEKLWKNDDDLSDDDDDGTAGFNVDAKHKWFFYDTNQHLHLSEEQYQRHKKTLKKSTKLTKVLRNTGNVFDQSKKYFKSRVPTGEAITLGHQQPGLAIKWETSLPNRQVPESIGAKSVVKHIEELRRNKVHNKDICVLVENTEIRDRLSSELKRLKVDNQDAEKPYEENHDKVVVESIRRYKGLESKVVLLYNPRFFVDRDWPVKKVKELLYTAVSRCFCCLMVITTQHGYQALASDEGVLEGALKIGNQEKPIPMESLQNLEAERKSQTTALFREPFGRRSSDTQYESGPPKSPTKHHIDDDDDDDDDDISDGTGHPAIKISRMEEAQCNYQYEKMTKRNKPKKARPMRVEGSDLLEPGDKSKFRDNVRSGVFRLLQKTVENNLKHLPSISVMDPPNLDVTAIVAQIEYKVYCGRRNDLKTNRYTQDLRSLKAEIEKCNRDQKSHESVREAIRRLQNSSKGLFSIHCVVYS